MARIPVSGVKRHQKCEFSRGRDCQCYSRNRARLPGAPALLRKGMNCMVPEPGQDLRERFRLRAWRNGKGPGSRPGRVAEQKPECPHETGIGSGAGVTKSLGI